MDEIRKVLNMSDIPSMAHLSDSELLAWLDGFQEHAEHIESCEACRQRALALRIAERRLKSLFYRADCPPALTLAEYGAGLLEDPEPVRQHVRTCPHCSQELAWQEQFLRSLALPPARAREPEPPASKESLRDRVRVVVARWINPNSETPGIGIGFQYALGAMRGASDRRPMLFSADELQVTLEFYEDEDHPGKHQLVGLLVGEEQPERFKVQVWQEGTCVAETSVDELGNFAIRNLAPAQYDLKFLHPKLEIQLNALDI